MVLSRSLNALGLLAAPKAWNEAAARSGGADLRRGIVESVDEAAAALANVGDVELVTGPADTSAIAEPLARVREICQEQWRTGPPPEELVGLARSCLALLGVPEPAEGWDTFAPDDL